MAKFTRATANSFIKKNLPNLKIKVKSSFDGMIDGIRHTGEKTFVPVQLGNPECKCTMGVKGVWFVGGGRDYFTPRYDGDKLTGFECYNTCGTFELSI